jgi:hypothetical protein
VRAAWVGREEKMESAGTPEEPGRDQQRPEDGKPRSFEVSPLPLLADGISARERETLALALYGEICSSWRALVEVRFKLLGLIPAVSIIVLSQLLDGSVPGEGQAVGARIAIAVLGFLVTAALFIYERRNSALHDDLISRARRIESELGLYSGQFLGRLAAPSRLLRHDTAIRTIYSVVAVGWLSVPALLLSD